MGIDVEDVIHALGLIPHPEGGYYRETFRAPLRSGGSLQGPARSPSTAIYFLLPSGVFSAFHRVLGADELWHHYAGDPVELHTIDERGSHSVARLGKDIAAGERPQAVVPADTLQAARPIGNGFALCGCTVAPGFDYADFLMPPRAELLRKFPGHEEVIRALTRK